MSELWPELWSSLTRAARSAGPTDHLDWLPTRRSQPQNWLHRTGQTRSIPNQFRSHLPFAALLLPDPALSFAAFEWFDPIPAFPLDAFAVLTFLSARLSSSLSSNSDSPSSSDSDLLITTSASFFFGLAAALVLGAALGLGLGLVAVALVEVEAVAGEEAALSVDRVVRLVGGCGPDGVESVVALRLRGYQFSGGWGESVKGEERGAEGGGRNPVSHPQLGHDRTERWGQFELTMVDQSTIPSRIAGLRWNVIGIDHLALELRVWGERLRFGLWVARSGPAELGIGHDPLRNPST